MRIKFNTNGDVYQVTEGSVKGYVTLKNLTSEKVFHDYYTQAELDSHVSQGNMTIVPDLGTELNMHKPLTLEIKVDSKPLTDLTEVLTLANAQATALEATLGRIKAMLG